MKSDTSEFEKISDRCVFIEVISLAEKGVDLQSFIDQNQIIVFSRSMSRFSRWTELELYPHVGFHLVGFEKIPPWCGVFVKFTVSRGIF